MYNKSSNNFKFLFNITVMKALGVKSTYELKNNNQFMHIQLYVHISHVPIYIYLKIFSVDECKISLKLLN